MQNYDVKKIQEIIVNLKEIKTSSFTQKDGMADFQRVKDTCRMVDTFMLPLYYIWEHYCKRQLTEASFEEHLRLPYRKFTLDPKIYTWELYLFVLINNSNLISKHIRKKLLDTYKTFIDST